MTTTRALHPCDVQTIAPPGWQVSDPCGRPGVKRVEVNDRTYWVCDKPEHRSLADEAGRTL